MPRLILVIISTTTSYNFNRNVEFSQVILLIRIVGININFEYFLKITVV